jgi:hypothetical protein
MSLREDYRRFATEAQDDDGGYYGYYDLLAREGFSGEAQSDEVAELVQKMLDVILEHVRRGDSPSQVIGTMLLGAFLFGHRCGRQRE